MNLIKKNWKLILILSAEFIALTLCLVLIFFAGKKTYTVTFLLDEGTLLSGETVQRVSQGQSATPPQVAKAGHYLRGWSGSYSKVTRDVTVKAIWEYETSPGIRYDMGESQTYCEISGCYPEIQGDIYLGSYFDDTKILGVKENAFMGCKGITAVYMLDGILKIEEGAFSGCVSMTLIELPDTVTLLGSNAFGGCEKLESITLPRDLKLIGSGAFSDCTALTSITFGESLEEISPFAFSGCTALGDIIIPDGTLYLGEGAFSGCTAISKVTIPDTVTSVSKGAFSGCTALESVIISGLTGIEAGAFDTEGLTVYFTESEEELTELLADGWCSDGVTVVYDYVPEHDSESDAEKETGEKDDVWGTIDL